MLPSLERCCLSLLLNNGKLPCFTRQYKNEGIYFSYASFFTVNLSFTLQELMFFT